MLKLLNALFVLAGAVGGIVNLLGWVREFRRPQPDGKLCWLMLMMLANFTATVCLGAAFFWVFHG